ncbi:MAG: phosphoglucosamine mutase, partial [Thermoanaerobacteraceae bacterium]|nr:phosphoglucosamine mutase [Thermoanaerobacteraceae bacterium]
MKARLFGTDGVRGVANEDLSPTLTFKLGRAGAKALSKLYKRPVFVVGKDTRISGDMLEAALIAGICSAGADVLKVGIVPTPAVAYLTRFFNADAGVVISASHNPVEYNGIKFFNKDGYKLPDAMEDEIEALIDDPEQVIESPTGPDV